jgi:hypothetical protein
MAKERVAGGLQQSQRSRRVNLVLLAVLSVLLLDGSRQASASLLWDWRYTGSGVIASGTLSTEDKPDPDGFYRIIGITGTVNESAITGLQKTDTAIPGNSGFVVDNLIGSTPPLLTTHGFGFSVSNGDYHNPFFIGGYRDYMSVPPYVDGAGGEPAIDFKAALSKKPN